MSSVASPNHTPRCHCQACSSTSTFKLVFSLADFNDPPCLLACYENFPTFCYQNFPYFFSSRGSHSCTTATTACFNRHNSFNICIEIRTRYVGCPHTQICKRAYCDLWIANTPAMVKDFRHYWQKFKGFWTGEGRERAEGTKRKRLQKKRRDADQAPLLAPRVEAETPSKASSKSWPARKMTEVVLPDE